MKIYSDFHDYYDSVQKTQYDVEGNVWIRKNRFAEKDQIEKIIEHLGIEIDKGITPFKPRSNLVLQHRQFSKNRNILHTCFSELLCIAGKIYPMFEVEQKNFNQVVSNRYYFNYNDFSYNPNANYFFREITFPQWFFKNKKQIDNFESWAILNTPIFLIYPKNKDWKERQLTIECNPCLKEFGFESVLDPYTIWQEIDMFLRNQLVHEIDPGTIDEKYRFIGRGFDPKLSFRKASEG